jgi:2-oxoglutarate ferredoxin oxidoreductase subunit alpha
MMEKVYLKDQKARWTDEEIHKMSGDWATYGRTDGRERNIITSLDLKSEKMEERVHRLQAKYKQMEDEDLRFEEIQTEDADYIIMAYGSSARIAQKTVELAREKGIKVGILRPITLFPFPKKRLMEMTKNVKGILSVELNMGQMVDDIRLAVEHKIPVEHFGRTGGIIHTPEDILEALEEKIVKG